MLTTLLIGAAIGAGLAVAVILGVCKVQTKESWQEEQASGTAMRTCLWLVTAENAKLRVALAAGEMTEDGKKIAAMTMASLGTVIAAAAKEVMQKRAPSSPLNNPPGEMPGNHFQPIFRWSPGSKSTFSTGC